MELKFIPLPFEFVSLLKMNLTSHKATNLILKLLNINPALTLSVEKVLKEFDDGRGFEKTLNAIGWHSLRDRLALMYIMKILYGIYPHTTDLSLVQDLKNFENRFSEDGLHGQSRVFLLGFYLKLMNLSIKEEESRFVGSVEISQDVDVILRLSQSRSDRIDFMILILAHLIDAFGIKFMLTSLSQGKKIDFFYEMLPVSARFKMQENLLAYSASINEVDIFTYDMI